MIQGGCFCKKVRYEIEDAEYLTVNCHCTMCRHTHSALYVTWMVVDADKHRYITGAPARLESSEQGTRYFCSGCGTHVACVNAEYPEIIDIPVGSLDEPERFKPTKEVFSDTRLPWLSKTVESTAE